MAPPGLGLALLGALVSMSAAEAADPALENHFPPHWAQAPGDLDSFGKEGNHSVIDPWSYRDRMGMYRTLLNHTHQYFAILGLNETDNLLWGLPLQLGWQFETGRLADPSRSTTCGDERGDLNCISPSSWWACMNYFLAAVPFLAAAEAGIFENWQNESLILPPKKFSNHFCYTYAGCNSSLSLLMGKWKLYFEKLMATKPESDVPSAIDKLLSYMWDAHEESVDSALPRCKNRLQFPPSPEVGFDEDWAAAVYFIGATHFSTDYQNIQKFQANLPPRLLRDGDKCPLILDFTLKQNAVCATLKMLRALNRLSGGSLLVKWKQAMCSPKGRQICRGLLESMFAGKIYTLFDLFGILSALAGTNNCIPGPQK
ncbi:protein LEG1 homolog [Lissotriton helveticus]